MRLFHVAGTILALLAIAGCVRPYKLEVQQGNVVTQEMLEKLRPGLTKSQVRFVLGTPLIADPFHPERWDYVYVYKKHATAPAETRHLTVIFEGDTLTRVEGDRALGTTDDDSPTSAADSPILPRDRPAQPVRAMTPRHAGAGHGGGASL